MKLNDFNPNIKKPTPTPTKAKPVQETAIVAPVIEEISAPIFGLEESDLRIVERWKRVSPDAYKRLINWD